MATWIDLYGSDDEFVSRPKAVCLVVGEQSLLTQDKISKWVSSYPIVHRSLQPYRGFDSVHSATYLTSPTEEDIEEVCRRIKAGSQESFFIVTPEAEKSPSFEYVKKKAQQNKMYYTISAPSSEAAQGRMVSFYVVQWGVGTDAVYKVCSSLNFSPGQMYAFDKMFTAATGGAMLPSTKTNALIEGLLGQDTETRVVQKVLSSEIVDSTYSPEFSLRALKYMSTLVNDALVIKSSAEAGMSTYKEIAQFTGMSMFEVSRSFGLSEAYSKDRLDYMDAVITYGMFNAGNPEVLSVVSQALSK